VERFSFMQKSINKYGKLVVKKKNLKKKFRVAQRSNETSKAQPYSSEYEIRITYSRIAFL